MASDTSLDKPLNSHYAGNSDTSFEDAIASFGRRVFNEIGESQPSVFSKNFWSGKVLSWSMTKPEVKRDLFRLVDVLPALSSDQEIVDHVHQYLNEDDLTELFPVGKSIVRWGLRGSNQSLRGKLLAVAVRRGVREMASQFIAGETPNNARKELARLRQEKLAFTVDLLGEYSLSEDEAHAYVARYQEAITALASVLGEKEKSPLLAGHPGEESPLCISVKLSALYSQCSTLNFARSVQTLTERLAKIARVAKEHKSLLYVDAEDSHYNPLVYETFERVFSSDEFRDFYLPGIVVQAYMKDSETIVQRLISLAESRGGPVAIRLVKGAYWDSETALAQQHGWESPLFARKPETDQQFELLSRLMLDNHTKVFPAFGSHNVRSLSHACAYAEKKGLSPRHFEIQTLYGMAEPIAKAFSSLGYLTRVYVPLGELIPGMGYLVRRLLENTSNESFLRHTFFESHEVDALLKAPVIGPR